MGAFEQLLEDWRSNPDSDSTVALCTRLGVSPREDLVREVGARAEQWHANDGDVMLAVGRMYLEAGLLAESQNALVNAGKANPRDGRAFRYLGEVLLRRGDAGRAEKVLQRAMQLGASDADTKLWHDRALGLRRAAEARRTAGGGTRGVADAPGAGGARSPGRDAAASRVALGGRSTDDAPVPGAAAAAGCPPRDAQRASTLRASALAAGAATSGGVSAELSRSQPRRR